MATWIIRTAVAAALVLTMQMTGDGQAGGAASDLGARLRERFDVVALQQGVALVPRQTTSGVRLIQVEGGLVTVDGQVLTGAQLRERLAAEADLIVQVSYLTAPQQRDLAGAPAAAAPAPEVPAPVERTNVSRGDRARFGEDLRIEANERVDGDVAVFGGSADVDGEITGDLAVFGGGLRLGPQSVVHGDIFVMGGSVDRASGAQVLGEMAEMGGRRGGFGPRRMMSGMFGSFWSRLGSLAATLARVALLVLLGLIVVAFGRGPIERIAARTAAAPVRSGLIGLLAELLFVPVLVLTVVVLAVSIVGIPLLALIPFAVLLLMLVMLVGFIALAYQLGRRLTDRFGWTERGAYGAVALGVVAIGAVTVLAKLAALWGGVIVGGPLTVIGYGVEYIAWTVGFGAALLSWYDTRTRFGARRGGEPPIAPAPGEA